jgi:hypothetical protein
MRSGQPGIRAAEAATRRGDPLWDQQRARLHHSRLAKESPLRPLDDPPEPTDRATRRHPARRELEGWPKILHGPRATDRRSWRPRTHSSIQRMRPAMGLRFVSRAPSQQVLVTSVTPARSRNTRARCRALRCPPEESSPWGSSPLSWISTGRSADGWCRCPRCADRRARARGSPPSWPAAAVRSGAPTRRTA